MIKFVSGFVKNLFNLVGLDLIRISKRPKYSLLGLRNLTIKTIIDIGANRGQFAKYISAVFPEAHLYCFEPLKEPYSELNKWAKKQRKVKALNFALGDKAGKLNIFHHCNHDRSSSFLKTTEICAKHYPLVQKQVAVPVDIITLDNWFFSLSPLPGSDILIKLDVQGYENRVIRGGTKTFNVAKACIVEVSLDNLYDGQSTFQEIASLLYDIGYHYVGNLKQTYGNYGHVLYIDAVFVK